MRRLIVSLFLLRALIYLLKPIKPKTVFTTFGEGPFEYDLPAEGI